MVAWNGVKRCAALLLLVAAVACPAKVTLPSTPAPVARDIFIRAAPERVWDALLVIYTDLSIPIENMDRASWFMRSQETSLPPGAGSTFADCGTLDGLARASQSYTSVFLRSTTLLRPNGDSTGVRVTVTLRGVDNIDARAGNGGNLSCISNGKMEARIIELIRRRLSP